MCKSERKKVSIRYNIRRENRTGICFGDEYRIPVIRGMNLPFIIIGHAFRLENGNSLQSHGRAATTNEQFDGYKTIRTIKKIAKFFSTTGSMDVKK